MKRLVGSLLVIACMVVPPAWGASLADSPLLGTWQVDVTQLPMPPEARPRQVSARFALGDDGRLVTRVEVIDAAGAVLFAQSELTLDGVPGPVAGNLEADTAAASMPAPNVLVMPLARGTVPGSTRIYTVAPDGKSMIETASNFGDDGRPMMRINHFTRVD